MRPSAREYWHPWARGLSQILQTGPKVSFTAKNTCGQGDLGHNFRGLKAAVRLAVGFFSYLVNTSVPSIRTPSAFVALA